MKKRTVFWLKQFVLIFVGATMIFSIWDGEISADALYKATIFVVAWHIAIALVILFMELVRLLSR